MELKMERNFVCSSNHKHVQLGYILSISTCMQCKNINQIILKPCDYINSRDQHKMVSI